MDVPRTLSAEVHDSSRVAAVRRTRLLDTGPEEAFDRLTRLAARLLDAPVALMTLVDDDRQYFKSQVDLAEPHASDRQTPLSHSICQHALLSADPLVISDTRARPDLEGNQAITDLGAIAYLGSPLIDVDGHVLGSFCVIDHVPREWTPQHIEILGELAASVMSEISLRLALHDRDRLAVIESDGRRVAEALFKTAEALARCATVDDIASCIVEFAPEVVDATFANIAVAVPDADMLEIWHGSGIAGDIEDRWPLAGLDDSTPLGHAVVHDEAVWLDSAAEIRKGFPGGAADSEAAGLTALAAVPVPGAQASLGFAWSGEMVDRDQGLSRLRTIAEMCGQAIERARLYERERLVAHELQARMLPATLATIPGFDLAARYLAGDDEMEVGGDWYDTCELGPDRFVVAVGDIVGHGLEAAAAMGRLRAAFSALALHAESLENLVARLDEYAADDGPIRLSTMVAVEVDASRRVVRSSSAGHVPILVRRADGEVETIFGAGTPLGFDVEAARETTTTELGPGDTLLLYTDGLVERPGELIDDGIDRLASVLADAPNTSADAVCDAIIEGIGGVDSDDIALLVLQG